MSDKAIDRVLAVIGGIIGGAATGAFTLHRWLRYTHGRVKK